MNTEQEIDDEVCEIMMNHGPDGHVDGHDMLTELVMRRVAAERERCAQVCEEIGAMDALAGEHEGSVAMVRVADRQTELCAAAIRATPNV